MAIVNQMSYRGITQRRAEWIGMAASVAGGFVAVEGSRIERISRESIDRALREIDYWAADGCGVEDMQRDLADMLAGTHALQGGDFARVGDGGDNLVLCVPAGGPLSSEGFSLPEALVADWLGRRAAMPED